MAASGERPTILAVDKNRRNLELLAQFLEGAGYGTHKVSSVEELEDVLSSPLDFALALVDLSGFQRQIWDQCEQLRNKGVPFLLISPRPSPALQRESVARGARGVLVKPVRVHDLVGLINRLMTAS